MMKWVDLVFRVIPYIVAAVAGVERILTGAPGKQKQDAAVELVGTMLEAIEGIVRKDLLENDEVQKALRAAIDAVVALQNAIAKVRPPQLVGA